jgi:hypothetical protein
MADDQLVHDFEYKGRLVLLSHGLPIGKAGTPRHS